MRLIACILLAFALFSGAGLSAPTAAQEDGGLSLEQAVKRIKEQDEDIRVLSAERVQSDGKWMYRIKVLTPQGRVRHIWIDPGG